MTWSILATVFNRASIFPLSFAVPFCGTIKQIIDINFYDVETQVKETCQQELHKWL